MSAASYAVLDPSRGARAGWRQNGAVDETAAAALVAASGGIGAFLGATVTTLFNFRTQDRAQRREQLRRDAETLGPIREFLEVSINPERLAINADDDKEVTEFRDSWPLRGSSTRPPFKFSRPATPMPTFALSHESSQPSCTTLSTAHVGHCASLFAMAGFKTPRAKITKRHSICSKSSMNGPLRTATSSLLSLRHTAANGSGMITT